MPQFGENVEIEFSGDQGSPTLFIRSRGSGTQRYSVRVTNNSDPAGGRQFIIRNEDQARDVLLVDVSGTITVTGDLSVSGNIRASRDIAVSGDVRLAGADCAEHFDVVEGGGIGPGAVVIIAHDGRLRRSSQPYDKRVAGVVSGGGDCRPGIVLDQHTNSVETRLPIALVGKVYCQVDADQGAIDEGDLLTTSSTPGHAMKVSEPAQAFGCVIGKALRPLAAGKSMIPILVALQ